MVAVDSNYGPGTWRRESDNWATADNNWCDQILIDLGIPAGRKKKAEETTKPKEEETAPVAIESPVVQSPVVQPLIQSPIQQETEVVAQPQAVPSVQQQPNIVAVSTPEVSVRTKRRTSVKVTSSGQQTTLTFQKKSSANSDENIQKNPQRRTRSCIVDDTFRYCLSSFH